MENGTARGQCKELLSEIVEENTVITRYKVGYADVIVSSQFTGNENLSDLLYKIITRENEKHL